MATEIQPIDRDEWRQVAPGFMDYNYRQVWDFGVACARRRGAGNEHVAIREGANLIGLADVRVKKVPLLGTGIAYINGGPLTRRSDRLEPDVLRRVLSALVEEYVRRRKFTLRIQPLPASAMLLEGHDRIFQEVGFAISNQLPYRTIIIDISSPVETIKSQFDRSWRRNLGKADKLEVVTGTDDSLFAIFCQIYDELIKRKSFDIQLDADFYREVQSHLTLDEAFLVGLIYENGQPAAGRVYSVVGDTCVEVLAAANGLGLKNGASHLAVWSIIEKAKERGCRHYDLCGIDPEKNPGGYQFKRGTGGADVKVPLFEYSPSVWFRGVLSLGERAYRFRQKMRRP